MTRGVRAKNEKANPRGTYLRLAENFALVFLAFVIIIAVTAESIIRRTGWIARISIVMDIRIEESHSFAVSLPHIKL